MGTSQRTMARTALTLVLCLGVAAVLVTGAPIHTLRVKRSPGSFVKDVNAAAVRASTVMTRSHFRAGSHAVPMNGGYLTTGAYFMDITVGSLDQTFSVLVDTGSSNLALPSPSCNCGTSNATVYYDPAKSKTSAVPSCTSPFCQACVPVGYNLTACPFGEVSCGGGKNDEICPFGISYGGGSSALGGYWATDKVCLGEACAYNAVVGAITEQVLFSSNANTAAFVGIIGFASPFNAVNPTAVAPIMSTLVAEGEVAANVLGMCFTNTSGGVIDLGAANMSRVDGTMQWVPITTDRWYNLPLKTIAVGTHDLGLPSFVYKTTNDVIGSFIDSGTSVILTSPVTFEAMTAIFESNYGTLPGISGDNNLFAGACFPSSVIDPVISEYPALTFTFGGVTMDAPVDIVVEPAQYLLFQDGMYCLGVAGVPGVGAVMGDNFLVDRYVVYDRENMQVGFANAAAGACDM